MGEVAIGEAGQQQVVDCSQCADQCSARPSRAHSSGQLPKPCRASRLRRPKAQWFLCIPAGRTWLHNVLLRHCALALWQLGDCERHISIVRHLQGKGSSRQQGGMMPGAVAAAVSNWTDFGGRTRDAGRRDVWLDCSCAHIDSI